MRKGSSVKTQYTGVVFNETLKKYVSTIKHENKVIRCGVADTAKDAAVLRDIQIIKLNLPYKKLQVLKPSL
jgi:hypothetical protein